MVVQNISSGGKETDLTFTTNLEDLNKTQRLVRNNKTIKYKKLIINKNVSKVSIVGVGMITTPGVTYRMFKALAKKKINIEFCLFYFSLILYNAKQLIKIKIRRGNNIENVIDTLSVFPSTYEKLFKK